MAFHKQPMYDVLVVPRYCWIKLQNVEDQDCITINL